MVGHSECRRRSLCQQCRLLKAELGRDGAKILGAEGIWRRGRGGDRFHKEDVVAEPPQAENVLQHGPRGAPLVRIGGNHSAYKNGQSG